MPRLQICAACFDHVTGLFCMAFGTNIVAQEARARNTELHSAACYQHDSRPCSCWFGGCGWQLGLCARCLATWKHPISQACSCHAQDGDWEWLGFAADFSRRRGLGTVLQPCDCGASACWRGGSQDGASRTNRWGDPGKGLWHPLGLHH